MTDELRWALDNLQWQSIEKDNMEFKCTASCYVRDIILNALSAEEVKQ